VNKRMSFPRHGRRSTTRRHGPRRKRYLLVTAGTVTERDYFKSLQELFDVVIDVEATAKSPVELAKRAARLYRSDMKEQGTEHYSHVWVVVDVDQYSADNLVQAEKICKQTGVKGRGAGEYPVSLIVSDPCFEVWLIDHQQVCPSSITETSEAEQFAIKLDLVDGSNNKHLTERITNRVQIQTRLNLALSNAKKHNRTQRPDLRSGAHLIPPWTDMPEVLEQLERDTKKHII
jgi:hypothetical protein